MPGPDGRVAGALPGRVRRRGSPSARCTRGLRARSQRALALLAERGDTYRREKAHVAAQHRIRRRQGPRAGALQRRAHLLHLGHRLPPGQARARLRAPDRRVGRRPPRLRRAHEGRLRGARRRPRAAGADHHAARPPACAAASAPQMSKREGEFVTLDELVERDRRRRGALLPALALARHDGRPRPRPRARESSENPVYYVQYAHARIASMLAKAGAERVAEALAQIAPGEEPLHASERALIKRLLAFPGELAEAAMRRAPHRIAAYALELAQDFTAFYRDCRVLGAEPAARRVAADRAVRRGAAHDRALPGRPARGRRAAGDVGGVGRASRSAPCRPRGGPRRRCSAPRGGDPSAARAACAARARRRQRGSSDGDVASSASTTTTGTT